MGARGKSASQIKTLSSVRGCGVHSNERHVHQFQIAVLELEHSRRARERQAAANRIKMLDSRLLEIDVLIRLHQEALGVTSSGDPSGPTPMLETKPAGEEKRRTLRY